MQTLATLLIGYSLFSAVVIGLTHFRPANYLGQRLSQVAGLALLLILSVLQLAHLAYLHYGGEFIHSAVYRMLLFAVAPGFYLFSKPLLQAHVDWQARYLLHLVPVLATGALPYRLALPLAFAVGALYLLWLAQSVYALRAQRARFRLELALLAGVFGVALVVTGLGLGLHWLGEYNFYVLYASAIGGAFLLVSLALGMRPELARDVGEAVQETYAVSTLTQVDCPAALTRLAALMDEGLYRQTTLDLATLAGEVGLSSHQLSELINTRLGKNFSRYLREYRVADAQRMLLAEPAASVLSVGLSVGFTSQSGFYEAFREITGMTPGKYRKLHAASTPD